MADRSVTFDIIGRDRASHAFDSAGKSSGRLHGKLSSLGGFMAGGLAAAATVAAAGLAAVGSWLVQGVKDAASYQALQSKTAAVLKSTGNSARTSVKHIQDLAGSLESLSGVDEELIINSQNVLATFTKVQNKAGKGNDIFDQATKAALDMSTALGTDLQGATLQVGKALNDPIKGVTALRRVGVSFTADQLKQIKRLTETGQAMKAQKLILAELNKEFGGQAKAAGAGFSGSMARMKDAVSDAGRAVGAKLLPYVTAFANWVTTTGIPGIQRLIAEFRSKFGPTLDKIGNFIKTVWIPSIKKAFANPDVQQGLKKLAFLAGGLAVAIGAVVAVMVNNTIVMVAAAGWITNKVGPAFRWLAGTVLAALGAIVGGAASAFGWIPGIGPKLKAAKKDFDQFRDQVNATLGGINNRHITVTAEFVRTGAFNDNVSSRDGARASGGPVRAGGRYLVGERGPEVVTFGQSGYVTANNRLGGGTININVSTAPGGEAEAGRQIVAAIQQYERRSGSRWRAA